MTTPNQKRIAQLEAQVEYRDRVIEGLNECLEVANQMLVAAALKTDGAIKLTPADFRASAGLQFNREEIGDDVVLTVQDNG